MSDPETKEFLEAERERKDRESLTHIGNLQGLVELLATGCGVPWAGIVLDHHNEAPLWVAWGPGASSFARSEGLWRLGRQAKEFVAYLRDTTRPNVFDALGSAGSDLGMLAIAPVITEEKRAVAFVWVADRRAHPLSERQRRVIDLIAEEVRLRYELRQRLLDKLDMISTLRQVYEELRTKNRELVMARDRALEGERAKAVFLTNLGHELRTPLNAILGFTEMVLEEARELGRESMVVPLEHVLDASHRLSEMIENALYVARVDTKRMPLYLETFDVGQLLMEAADAIRPLAIKRHNELTVRLASNLGSMYADPSKVRQIVYNLLNNACKFTENGRVSLTATRLRQTDGEHIRIVVADTGPGMSQEEFEKLCDEVVPVDSYADSPPTGLAVGLAVARRFCKLMNGSLRAVSQPGGGTRMVVTLPVTVKTESTPFPSSGTMKAVSSVLPEPSPSAPLVLVIESDPETRDVIASTLRRANCRVVEASKLPEVLAAVEKEPPKVVTLDVNLTDDDGWQILAKLRTIPTMVTVPILLVTETVDQNLALEVGATDVISKPISSSVLSATVKRWLKAESAANDTRLKKTP
jgi:signal transduction histidine kinase/CheY-like chemotaxis protein